jgi:hypothetical protein
VLVIWQDIPSRTALYLVEFTNEQAYRRCLTCHGEFLNQVHNDEIEENLNELAELLDHLSTIYNSDSVSRIVPCVDKDTKIIVCGILE